MKTDPDSPALPTDSERQNGPNSYHFAGFTKREELAKAAQIALLSNTAITWSPQGVASRAVEYADALISELNKGEP